MSPSTPRLEQALDEIAKAVKGGVDAKDLALICEQSMIAAEELGKVDGDEKAAFALEFATGLVEEYFTKATPELEAAIEAFDFPYVPEGVEKAVLDPVVKAAAPHVLRWLIKQSLPAFFSLVVRGTRGELAINGPGEAQE